jgi:biopolymer transport protein ExbD
MLKVPSSRKRRKPESKLNLVPIMDAIFIFIFFLLMSATFLKIYEVGSDVPIVSDAEPPKDQKDPLALSLKIETNEIILSKGVPSRTVQSFQRQADGSFNLDELHGVLVGFKKKFVNENTIILEPVGDLTYDEIVKIMDSVRKLNKTDEAIYKPNKEGIDEKIKELFSKIIFSNLMS